MKPIADRGHPSSWHREGLLWVPHSPSTPAETNWSTFAWAVQHLAVLAGLAAGLAAISLYTYAAQEGIPLRFHHGELAHLLPWFTAAGGALILLPALVFAAIGVWSHTTVQGRSETLARHLAEVRWPYLSSSLASACMTVVAAFGLPTMSAIGIYVVHERGMLGEGGALALGAIVIGLLTMWLWRKSRVVHPWLWPVVHLLPVAICIVIALWPSRFLFLGTIGQVLAGTFYAMMVVVVSGLSAMGAHRLWRSGLPRLVILIFVTAAVLFLTTSIGPRGAHHALALLGLGGGISFNYALHPTDSEEGAGKKSELTELHAGLIIDTGDQVYVRTCHESGRIKVLDWSRVAEFKLGPSEFKCSQPGGREAVILAVPAEAH